MLEIRERWGGREGGREGIIFCKHVHVAIFVILLFYACTCIRSVTIAFICVVQMFPVALVCGNTFVLKPSELDPGATMMLMEMSMAAGVPDGVVNVIHGQKEG